MKSKRDYLDPTELHALSVQECKLVGLFREFKEPEQESVIKLIFSVLMYDEKNGFLKFAIQFLKEDKTKYSKVLDEIESRSANPTHEYDEMLPQAVEIVLNSKQASISTLQRHLQIGYARSARLIDEMEQLGIVSGFEGGKTRKILTDRAEFERMFGRPPKY